MEPPWTASARELRAAPEMQDRFVGLADALHERGEGHVAVVRGLQGEARLDVALRLAPELLAHAQLAEREQERGVARMLAQPLLGALDLRQRARPRGFPVERHEARVPFALERLLDDRLRFGGAAEGEVVARGRGRDGR